MTSASQRSKATIALQWWAGLNPREGQSGSQRAALARLRRAATPLEVIQQPEALHLIARLPHSTDRVATLAGILAFVREEDDDRKLARVVGRPSLDSDVPPALSESRFRRLLQVPPDELMEPMRRVVRLADKNALNVLDLSHSVLYWGDRVKRQWIFDYYGVAASIRFEPGASL